MKDVSAAIESLLLVSERPVSLREIAAATGEMIPAVQQAVAELTAHYSERGIRIVRKGDYVQFATAPEQVDAVRKFFNRELRASLTPPALETLAIVVYREPVTRGEIEEIRGVNSETILRTLLIRGLIREVGRAEGVGRPIIYGTTLEFLQYFGLEKSDDLPPPPVLPTESSSSEKQLFPGE